MVEPKDMDIPNRPNVEKQEIPKTFITFEFPNGLDSTSCTVSMSNIGTPQVELAGRFAIRLAEQQYEQARINSAARHPALVVPRGFDIPDA